MDSFSNRFERLLSARVEEAATKSINILAEGGAQTFEDYRERVGYIRALGDVRSIIADVKKTAAED